MFGQIPNLFRALTCTISHRMSKFYRHPNINWSGERDLNQAQPRPCYGPDTRRYSRILYERLRIITRLANPIIIHAAVFSSTSLICISSFSTVALPIELSPEIIWRDVFHRHEQLSHGQLWYLVLRAYTPRPVFKKNKLQNCKDSVRWEQTFAGSFNL